MSAPIHLLLSPVQIRKLIHVAGLSPADVVITVTAPAAVVVAGASAMGHAFIAGVHLGLAFGDDSTAVDQVPEALRTLADFARSAPGRLPEAVQAALRVAESGLRGV